MGIASILLWLRDNWKVAAIAAIIIAIVVYVESLRVEIALKDGKITSLQADLAVAQQNNITLTGAVNAQNDAVGKISALADQTKRGFDALGVNVAQQTSVLDSRLAAILKDKKPVTCEDTVKYLIDAAKGYK